MLSVLFSGHALAAPLINGGSVSGAILISGQQNSYEFNATEGEHLTISVADTALTSMYMYVTLYGPNGNQLSVGGGYTVAQIYNFRAPQSGQYTAIVRSTNTSTGLYTVHFAKAPQANEHGDLVNGGHRTGTIDLGDLDTYTFEATEGEYFSISAADIGNTSLYMYVTLYGPDGNYLTRAGGYHVGEIYNFRAPTTGRYVVQVQDASTGNASTGDYNIYFAKAPQANEHGELINGGVLSETIDLGDLDTYTFEATAGEYFSISAADIGNTSLYMYVTLYGPDGNYLTRAGGYHVGEIYNFRAPATGRYVVQVQDASTGNASTGDYEIHFVKAPGANEHGTLANAGSRTEVITLGDLDSYTFNGVPGASITLTVTDLNATSLYPYITLYGPDGTYLTRAGGYTVASINNYTLSATGTYTVQVQDASTGNASTGEYRLDFNVPNTPPVNTTPIAVISAPASVKRGEAIILDGSNSAAPNGTATGLSYDWQLGSAPDGSTLTTADINNANQAVASVTPDVAGDYVFELTVSDSTDNGSSQIFVTVANTAPTANAGEDIVTTVGVPVLLNGSNSSDPDADPLTYSWTLVSAPAGSAVISISNSTAVQPNFTPDVAGNYEISLIVSDGLDDSVVDVVVVQATAANLPPVANILMPTSAALGETIALNGSASSDPEGSALTYLWQIISAPSGSSVDNASISDANSVSAYFLPDIAGEYQVMLTVSDGTSFSHAQASVLVVAAQNQPPVANAGADSTVTAGDSATLDGSASNDPDAGPGILTFQWEFVSVPAGSTLTNASILSAASASASFVPDVQGDYVLRLCVLDGESTSCDNVLIHAQAPVTMLMCDMDGNHIVDSMDISRIMQRRNTPALGDNDPADWNEDGVINVLDARGCTRLCTFTNCASQ